MEKSYEIYPVGDGLPRIGTIEFSSSKLFLVMFGAAEIDFYVY